jgi:hypothetical protein
MGHRSSVMPYPAVAYNTSYDRAHARFIGVINKMLKSREGQLALSAVLKISLAVSETNETAWSREKFGHSIWALLTPNGEPRHNQAEIIAIQLAWVDYANCVLVSRSFHAVVYESHPEVSRKNAWN